MKELIKIFAYGTIISIILLGVILLSGDSFLHPTISLIQDLRGTAFYEGETDVQDRLGILATVICPRCWILGVLVSFAFRRYSQSPRWFKCS